jgi:hypothetical protein
MSRYDLNSAVERYAFEYYGMSSFKINSLNLLLLS